MKYLPLNPCKSQAGVNQDYDFSLWLIVQPQVRHSLQQHLVRHARRRCICLLRATNQQVCLRATTSSSLIIRWWISLSVKISIDHTTSLFSSIRRKKTTFLIQSAAWLRSKPTPPRSPPASVEAGLCLVEVCVPLRTHSHTPGMEPCSVWRPVCSSRSQQRWAAPWLSLTYSLPGGCQPA